MHFLLLPEIAPYALPEDNGATGIVSALLREVQYEVQKEIMPAGMVCTNDLVALLEENQIHPANKKGVGMRLAHLALNQTYEHGEIISLPVLLLRECVWRMVEFY